MSSRIPLNQQELAEFCRRWSIAEFALFGSVLRADFRPDSDVDVLVSFDAAAHWTLLDMSRLHEELARLFGRPVDVLTRRAVERSRNATRRQAILSSAEVVHAG